VRVVAGRFGGRRLAAPRGRATRPTADRVREALFSMLGDVSQARVLDLYAGSGALGIEALSRGAQSALFVESDPRAVAVIRRNLTELGAEGEVRRQDVVRFLRTAAEERTTAPQPSRTGFDLVFCDPPYDLAPSPAAALADHLPAMTSDDARIVTESDKRRPLELPLPLLRERTYGDTRIAIHGG
jgi:16S rRNA (guanine966-N2)-methyltransferase